MCLSPETLVRKELRYEGKYVLKAPCKFCGVAWVLRLEEFVVDLLFRH